MSVYRFRIFFSVLLLFVPIELLAQRKSDSAPKIKTFGGRYQGDLGLQVNGYLWAPLFDIDPNAGKTKNPNLSLGGGADLAFVYYLTSTIGIGGFLDLGISAPANQDPVQDYLLAVLLGPRISYDINIYTIKYTSHPLFSFPLGFGLAISAVKFGSITNIIPVIKFDVGAYVNPFNQPEWAFGLSLHYWFVPEFTITDLSRIGNYLMIGIGFNFHSGG